MEFILSSLESACVSADVAITVPERKVDLVKPVRRVQRDWQGSSLLMYFTQVLKTDNPTCLTYAVIVLR